LFQCCCSKMVPTPFGLMPETCVHRGVGDSVTLHQVEGGVDTVYTNGTIIHFPALPECLEYQNRIAEMRAAKKSGGPTWVDGWLDYAGWYPPSDVTSFKGNYLVPPNPSANSAQVLFYFIGVENMNSGSGVTILQPVLTWGNGLTGWSFASWNCCPSGQAHESTPLQGFSAGATISGTIQFLSSVNNWEILSTVNGKTTNLTVADASREFNWADVTLETYSVTACNQFPNGPMTFTSLQMAFEDGSSHTPAWTLTGATECSGSITVQNPLALTITHSSS